MKKTLCRRIIASAFSLLLAFSAMAVLPVSAISDNGVFRYEHDPRLNSKAMKDIIVDPSAVYGFSPSPDGSLAAYAGYDWTDAEAVEVYRQNRLDYLLSYEQMYDILDEMISEGRSMEETARKISAKRNALRLAACEGDPGELAAVKARNLEYYGHEEGPEADELFEKYGSWETVIEKAFSHNAGMDACVGLYDDYHDYYIAFGYIEDESTSSAPREYAVAAFIDAFGLFKPSDTDILLSFADAGDAGKMYARELALAVEYGIVKGYEDNTLRPKAAISRAEALVMLSRLLPEAKSVHEPIEFSDVPEWARNAAYRLSAAGFAEGLGNGMLGAYDNLSVKQIKALVSRLKSAE